MNETRPLIWLLPVALAAGLGAWHLNSRPQERITPPEIKRTTLPPDPADKEAFEKWLAERRAASTVVSEDAPDIPSPAPTLTPREEELARWVQQRRMIGHRYNGDRRQPLNLTLLRIEDPIFEDVANLGEFPNLAHLDLLFPRFDQRGWDLLARTTRLSRLLAYKNRVPIPAEALDRLEVETVLILRNCSFDGGIPLDPEKLGSLRWLEISNCPVTTDDLLYLGDLASLEILDLENTRVDDALLPRLKNLTSLRILRLNGTDVTPEALDDWKAAHPDVTVNGERPLRL